MDILTPAGQETLMQERRAVQIFREHYPDLHYVNTDKDSPVSIDAVITKDNSIVAAAECKCRQMTEEEFFQQYDGQWLLTYDKLARAKELAGLMYVPLIGLLYLVPDDILLVKTLVRRDGTFDVSFSVDKTRTQATVNGGEAVRDNAYIDMNDAKILVLE